MRTRVEELREALQSGNVLVCGDSPAWIRQELVAKMDTLLSGKDDSSLGDAVAAFSMGAIRFVADRCGSECDELVEALGKLTD